MSVQLELWHLITLGVMFCGFLVGIAKWWSTQVEHQFAQAAESRKALFEQLSRRVAEVGEGLLREATKVQQLQHDLLKLETRLAVDYVRREDYVRGQSVIEARLDALYTKFEELLRLVSQLTKGASSHD